MAPVVFIKRFCEKYAGWQNTYPNKEKTTRNSSRMQLIAYNALTKKPTAPQNIYYSFFGAVKNNQCSFGSGKKKTFKQINLNGKTLKFFLERGYHSEYGF